MEGINLEHLSKPGIDLNAFPSLETLETAEDTPSEPVPILKETQDEKELDDMRQLVEREKLKLKRSEGKLIENLVIKRLKMPRKSEETEDGEERATEAVSIPHGEREVDTERNTKNEHKSNVEPKKVERFYENPIAEPRDKPKKSETKKREIDLDLALACIAKIKRDTRHMYEFRCIMMRTIYDACKLDQLV